MPSSWNFPSRPHLRFLKTPLPYPSLWRWRDVTRTHPPPSLSLSHRFHKLAFVWEGVYLTHTSLQTVNQKLLLKICICNKLAGQFCGWESLDELRPLDGSFQQPNPLVWLEAPRLPRKSSQGCLTPVSLPTVCTVPLTKLCLNSSNKMGSVKRQESLLESSLSCVILFDPESDSKDLFCGSSDF